ncbi:MAG: hypothetical protein ACI8UZ_003182 [Akkermansiaceae bacterium]|jgi:hypothetical protein
MAKDFVHRFFKVRSFKFLALARIDPRGEFGKLVGSKLLDSGFNFSDGAHGNGSKVSLYGTFSSAISNPLFGGVAAGVDGLQLGDTDLGVESGSIGFAVAQELLDVAAVGFVF